MTAEDYDIKVNQGADWTFIVRFLSSDGTTPINLTGCSALLTLKRYYEDPSPLEADTTITEPLNGQITARLTRDQTSSMELVGWVYDLDVTYAEGTVLREMQGEVYVSADG